MKQIIPIKKELNFKTKINKITSTNLEHKYTINNDEIVGTLYLNGSYKMTEASLIEEEYMFEIPFNIDITPEIDKDSIRIDIDDFKYDYDEYTMSIDVDLVFNCEKVINNELNLDEYFNDEITIDTDIKDNLNNNEITNIDVNDNEINTIIGNTINNNKYYTYKVYIVRSYDTLESICNKYNVNINLIKEYNDIDTINVGDKIIIPYINE